MIDEIVPLSDDIPSEMSESPRNSSVKIEYYGIDNLDSIVIKNLKKIEKN